MVVVTNAAAVCKGEEKERKKERSKKMVWLESILHNVSDGEPVMSGWDVELFSSEYRYFSIHDPLYGASPRIGK